MESDDRNAEMTRDDGPRSSSPFEAPRSTSREHPVALRSVELPRGGGAIRSISERYAANAATGSGGASIDLGLSPGRSGFGPPLPLAYDSGYGNGVPRYVDDLVAVGASRRVDEGGVRYEVRRYRPRVERRFSRVERWTPVAGGTEHWRVRSVDDVLSIFGRTTSARIADPSAPGRVFEWLLEEQWDGRSKAIHFVYKHEDLANVDASTSRSGRPRIVRRLPV